MDDGPTVEERLAELEACVLQLQASVAVLLSERKVPS